MLSLLSNKRKPKINRAFRPTILGGFQDTALEKRIHAATYFGLFINWFDPDREIATLQAHTSSQVLFEFNSQHRDQTYEEDGSYQAKSESTVSGTRTSGPPNETPLIRGTTKGSVTTKILGPDEPFLHDGPNLPDQFIWNSDTISMQTKHSHEINIEKFAGPPAQIGITQTSTASTDGKKYHYLITEQDNLPVNIKFKFEAHWTKPTVVGIYSTPNLEIKSNYFNVYINSTEAIVNGGLGVPLYSDAAFASRASSDISVEFDTFSHYTIGHHDFLNIEYYSHLQTSTDSSWDWSTSVSGATNTFEWSLTIEIWAPDPE